MNLRTHSTDPPGYCGSDNAPTLVSSNDGGDGA